MPESTNKLAAHIRIGDVVKFTEKGKLYLVINKSGFYVDKRNTGKIFVRFTLRRLDSLALSEKSVCVHNAVYQVS